MLRAAYLAQELLTTFENDAGEVKRLLRDRIAPERKIGHA